MKKFIHRMIRNSRTMSKDGIAKGVVLEWWNYETNIGDTLSPVIVNWVLNQKNIVPNCEKKELFIYWRLALLLVCWITMQ